MGKRWSSPGGREDDLPACKEIDQRSQEITAGSEAEKKYNAMSHPQSGGALKEVLDGTPFIAASPRARLRLGYEN